MPHCFFLFFWHEVAARWWKRDAGLTFLQGMAVQLWQGHNCRTIQHLLWHSNSAVAKHKSLVQQRDRWLPSRKWMAKVKNVWATAREISLQALLPLQPLLLDLNSARNIQVVISPSKEITGIRRGFTWKKHTFCIFSSSNSFNPNHGKLYITGKLTNQRF